MRTLCEHYVNTMQTLYQHYTNTMQHSNNKTLMQQTQYFILPCLFIATLALDLCVKKKQEKTPSVLFFTLLLTP